MSCLPWADLEVKKKKKEGSEKRKARRLSITSKTVSYLVSWKEKKRKQEQRLFENKPVELRQFFNYE